MVVAVGLRFTFVMKGHILDVFFSKKKMVNDQIWVMVVTPRKTNMTMGKQAFEDVSPTKKTRIFHCHVSFFFGGI